MVKMSPCHGVRSGFDSRNLRQKTHINKQPHLLRFLRIILHLFFVCLLNMVPQLNCTEHFTSNETVTGWTPVGITKTLNRTKYKFSVGCGSYNLGRSVMRHGAESRKKVAHCGFESHPVYTWQGSSPPSVPHTMRNGVMSVGERTLSYREND